MQISIFHLTTFEADNIWPQSDLKISAYAAEDLYRSLFHTFIDEPTSFILRFNLFMYGLSAA